MQGNYRKHCIQSEKLLCLYFLQKTKLGKIFSQTELLNNSQSNLEIDLG